MLLAEIAVPAPLGRPLTYAVPAEMAHALAPGMRVLCALGPRRVLAVVLDVREGEPDFDRAKLKPITALVDTEPVIGSELLSLLRELARYYLAPIGEVLQLALPSVERTQAGRLAHAGLLGTTKLPKVVGHLVAFVRPVAPAPERGEGAPALRGAAREMLAYLGETGENPLALLEEKWSSARAIAKKLAALGLVEILQKEKLREPFFADSVARDSPPELNASQAAAANAIEQALGERAAKGFLLFGVTGSGKTEVYLRGIAASRHAGRGALVLVPEIALTPQLVARYRARFGDEVAVVHSGLSEADRHAMWKGLRSGELQVAIGARSALFAPVRNLGLVIVDEEHDASFKQEEGTRYHARDMAILRAHRAGAVTVLGSATPSLESEMLARKGKLVRLVLPDRAHREAVLPKIELIDIKRFGPGPTGDPLLTLPLYRAMERTLAAGEQTILFLNRRGFAPSVICNGCGAIVSCRLCSVALTFHRAHGGRLVCHYCDYTGPLPSRCSSCGVAGLKLEGLGTEKLEASVAAAFPRARVARLDRDVAAGAKAEAVLARVRAGEVDVLVGTQMVTKGHDLPKVTLVGVVNADAALSVPDYRAAERGFQLLVQVAGRAGRGDHPGTVIVQTRNPEHPAIVFASRHDVPGFIERELVNRRELGYPPYARLALVRVDAADEEVARSEAARIAEILRPLAAVKGGDVTVLGPAPAPLARLRGRYRFQLLLRAKERPPLRPALLAVFAHGEKAGRRVRITIDVDPVQMM